MAKSRLVGSYPVIGIRPTIDGRRGALDVRGSLEEQTMNMAKSAAKLFEENLKYSNGEPVKVVIADTTIGRVGESAACADKFRKEGVDITVTVTPCWCYGAETMDMDPKLYGDSTEQRDLEQFILHPFLLHMHRRDFRHSVSTDMMFRKLMTHLSRMTLKKNY
jgi:hypothetical protein